MHAYNIEMLHQSVGEGDPRGDGWVFGLPPGIAQSQWPLDPNNGYPLNHGFTLRLPEDYRVHGPDIVVINGVIARAVCIKSLAALRIVMERGFCCGCGRR